MHWQASLLDSRECPAFDPAFAGLHRVTLDERSWVDLVPSWLTGSSELMAELMRTAPWQPQRQRHMYDRIVAEPRLVAYWASSADLPLAVEGMRRALSARYGVEFDAVGVNLYRDGRDSVAWHGDRIGRTMHQPLVAIVSVGEPRRFLLRPTGGRIARQFRLGEGDLIVMGGDCQRHWQHTVPKMPAAGARMSITFRHTEDTWAPD